MSGSNRPAVIQGIYADLKNVKTRSVVQIIIEVPLERAHEVTDIMGWPKPGAEQWVAVAMLNDQPQATPASTTRTVQHPAVIECVLMLKEDPQFRRWLCYAEDARDAPTEEEATAALRKELNIDSRKEIGTNEAVRNAWNRIVADYKGEKSSG